MAPHWVCRAGNDNKDVAGPQFEIQAEQQYTKVNKLTLLQALRLL